jgi:hypothetical protein
MTPEQTAAIQAQIAADLARLQAIVATIQGQIGNGH